MSGEGRPEERPGGAAPRREAAPPGGADLPVPAAPDPRGPLAREFAGLSAPQRTSMADVLAATFGPSDAPAMPAAVRAAYGQMRALGV